MQRALANIQGERFTPFLILFGIGVVFAIGYHWLRTPEPVYAQYSIQCDQFSSFEHGCGNNESCGLGYYIETAFVSTGEGINAAVEGSTNCVGTSCGAVPDVRLATNNSGYCCDRDYDGFIGNRPGCGTWSDCNDNNASIHPNATEICDSVDNNCDSNIDEGGVCCTQQTEPLCFDQGYGCGSFIDPHHGFCKPECCAACYANGGQYCETNCNCWTPIVIDVAGNGFNLTNGANGVYFKTSPDGEIVRTAWTALGSDDAFLVLDRNGNGTIDDGSELFGCSTPQPVPPIGGIGNGFIALAEYDKPANGGNGDSKIDHRDIIFPFLQLWRDTNHNGVSEQDELTALPLSEIRQIELQYRESRRQDQHGNRFKYRAKVRDIRGAHVGTWAWDVFPVVQP